MKLKAQTSFQAAGNLQQAPAALQSSNREGCEQVKEIKSVWLFDTRVKHTVRDAAPLISRAQSCADLIVWVTSCLPTGAL